MNSSPQPYGGVPACLVKPIPSGAAEYRIQFRRRRRKAYHFAVQRNFHKRGCPTAVLHTLLSASCAMRNMHSSNRFRQSIHLAIHAEFDRQMMLGRQLIA